MIGELNDSFGIDGHVDFRTGEGDLPQAVISNPLASAEVYLHGAHVTAFQPRGAEPLLWMSDRAEFRADKAIRGGIPVAWPWFGPHPTDEALPQHGFARVLDWSVAATGVLTDGRTELRLQLTDDERTRALWPHAFDLEIRVVVGASLTVELRTRNSGSESYEIGGALHTYFRVGDIERVAIDGLDGRDYLDQLDGHRVKRQSGIISFAGEVDRVYLDTAGACIIDDPTLGRRIRAAKTGSRTTVVWNPWVDKARRMADFPDDGYLQMVCIEATNAASDIHRVPPGGDHVLSQTISL